MDEPLPVIFFQDVLNSERKYGRLSRYSMIDDHTYLLYFEPFGQDVPEVLVIQYMDKDDWELTTLTRFTRRELGKET